LTLNLIIAAPWGVWLSSDFRVSDIRGGRVAPRHDHWSPKHVTVTTTDGAFVVTYAGVAEVRATVPELGRGVIPKGDPRAPGRVMMIPVAEWLTWILYGEGRTIDEAVEHIASEAGRVRELRTRHHAFNGVAIASGGVWAFQIANLDDRPKEDFAALAWARRPPLKQYWVRAVHIDSGANALGAGFGSGIAAVSKADARLMARISGCKPRDPHDYMNILAGVNARAAAADRSQSVSPACHVLYLDPHARPQDPGSQSEIYGNGQIPPDDFVPAILGNLFGIDLYSVTRDLLMRSSD